MSDQRMTGMTLERLRRIVDANGADPLRWPEAERVAAQAFLAQSSAARALVAQAKRLDGAMGALAMAVPDAAMARLAAATAFPPPRRATPALLDRLAYIALAFWPRAAVLTGMAVLGIVAGLTTEPAYSNSDITVIVAGDDSVDLIEELTP